MNVRTGNKATLTFEILPIFAIKPNARNSRMHPPAQVARLARSIKEFGFNAPLILGPNNELIAGHGRLAAAKDVGLTELPCVVLHHLDNDALQRAYMLADNRLSDFADIDDDMLQEELEFLKDVGIDLDLIGFESKSGLKLSREAQTPLNLAEPEPLADILVSVPQQHLKDVKAWLANGERYSSQGLGTGVLRRMGVVEGPPRQDRPAAGLGPEDPFVMDDYEMDFDE